MVGMTSPRVGGIVDYGVAGEWWWWCWCWSGDGVEMVMVVLVVVVGVLRRLGELHAGEAWQLDPSTVLGRSSSFELQRR